jgi:hypothetical protein
MVHNQSSWVWQGKSTLVSLPSEGEIIGVAGLAGGVFAILTAAAEAFFIDCQHLLL